MNKLIRRHFPESKNKYWKYFKHFLPLILGSTLFALNGVVDNFMVGQIEQGQTALGAVNQWTGIIVGWFVATAAAGSVVMAQFFNNKEYNIVRQVSRYRFGISILFVVPFFILAWADPDILISVFFKDSKVAHDNRLVYQNAREYIQIISFQWILFSFSFNLGNQLRELGHGKHAMMWGVGTLSVNVLLNSILMYVFGMGVRGAAIASVAGRIVAITWGTAVILKKKLPLSYNIFLSVNTSKKALKLFWSRWIYMISIFSAYFFIMFRMRFYVYAFPSDSELGIGIGAGSVLALAGSLMNVFTTTFAAVGSMVALFVGSELGKGNIKQAKKNALELKGFILTMSTSLTILMALFATALPYLSFFSESKYDENGVLTFDSKANLEHVRNTLYVIAAYYPMWTWFTSSYRAGNSGGRGSKFSIADWIMTGPIQLGWLAILTIVIVPASPYLQKNFAMVYFMFFLSDILKLIVQETLFYRNDKWLHSLTKKVANAKIIAARDIPGDSKIAK